MPVQKSAPLPGPRCRTPRATPCLLPVLPRLEGLELVGCHSMCASCPSARPELSAAALADEAGDITLARPSWFASALPEPTDPQAKELVDLDGVLGQVAMHLKPLWVQRQQQILWHLWTSHSATDAPQLQLGRLLAAALLAVLKATQPGGEVDIETVLETENRLRLSIRGFSTGNAACDPPGAYTEEGALGPLLSRIWQQLDHSRVQMVWSAGPAFAEVTLTLPVIAEPRVRRPEPDSLAHVLVVTPDPSQADVLARTLQALGHDVTVATGVGVGFSQTVQHPYDLVLTTEQLPDGDGETLLKGLRRLDVMLDRPATPAILLECPRGLMCPQADAAFEEHVRWPWNLEVVANRVSHLLHQRPPAAPGWSSTDTAEEEDPGI